MFCFLRENHSHLGNSFFSLLTFSDRLFKRGLSFVGRDYLCHTLWDKYIEFELSQRQWSSLAHIYIEALRFPTKMLHHYFHSFKRLGALWEEEMGCHGSSTMDQSEPLSNEEVHKDQISCVVKELLEPSIGLARSKTLHKYLSIGELLYQEACQLDEKIVPFETNIRRSYFHVKSLDSNQLENWHQYLDFVEKQGDFDWAVKLYERCLIPCAYYPEFWMRYVDFMETKGGREIANYALDRATQIFINRVPVIHLFDARYKEHKGDAFGAQEALLHFHTDSDSNFVENVTIKANMERRLGNFMAASKVYEEALEMAAVKRKLHSLPLLYIRFSRLKYMITNSAVAARDVLIDGIKHLPHCKLLLEELINFAMIHGGKQHINIVDTIISNAISPGADVSPGLNMKDAEDVSNLYLEFVDLCGNIDEVRRAWNQHIRLFPYSIRNFYEQSTMPKDLKLTEEGRGAAKSSDMMPQQSAGHCSSDCQIQLTLQEKKLPLPQTSEDVSGQSSTDQVSVQKLTSPENQDIQFEHATVDQLQSGEPYNEQQKLRSPSLEVSEHSAKAASELEVSKQHMESTAEPNVTSDLVCQATEETGCIQASQEYSNGNDVKQENDLESEQDLKPPSLASLSLHPQDGVSPDSVPPLPLRCKPPQETSNVNESMRESNCNTNQDEASDSARSYKNPVQTQPLLQSHVPANIGGNWSQMNNSSKVRRDSKFGRRGHMQRKPHQQGEASLQQYLPAEMGSSMPMSPGHYPQKAQVHHQAATAPGNMTTPISWPLQNVQQPNYSSYQSQLSTQAPQISHYLVQGEGQQATQNGQAYNQWWQYYYYQQQQFLLQQQQIQLQQQQQQPQQLSSQQYQQQQLQLQQHYFELQQPQLQQHQFLFHQQQHCMQQVVQQPQQPPLERVQHQQQNGTPQIQEWNGNYCQQDQGTAPSHVSGACAAVVLSVSPHSQRSTPPDQ